VLEEYLRRLAARRETLERQGRRERVITELRLIVFIAGLLLAWGVLGLGRVGPAWLAVPIGAFAVLLVLHARAAESRRRAERAVEFYQKGIARVEDRWAGSGEPGSRFLDVDHPYAADLDLFGRGSLFERLCTARTRAGEDALAAWLLAPAPAGEIVARQEAVAELRDRLDLREELELLGADVRTAVDPDALSAWGRGRQVLSGPLVPLIAVLLAAATVGALLAWDALGVGPTPFLALAAAELFFSWRLSGRVHQVLAPLDRRSQELFVLAHLLERLEREPFRAAALRRLVSELGTDGDEASRRIARLARLLHWLDAQKNQLFLPIAAICLWSVQFAVRIDARRGRSGPAIARWLAAVGDFEALCALAAYAYENPDDPFPAIEEAGACFEAEGLGHPLLPVRTCVRNDVRLGGEVRALVVSGSNMSGKSTLLRAVGINTVLALAGGPVRSRTLRVSPLAIGATLRIQDSLQSGRSRFFAEITRLRQLVDLSRGPLPLLFLLDEILHGTNSHDRRVGGESVLRGLIERGAIGLVTTHDLALAEIVAPLGSRAVNVHFEDHFEHGTLHFDYRMRPGVVRKSNALALMRAVGLDVAETNDERDSQGERP
jgi:hypothetical protein